MAPPVVLITQRVVTYPHRQERGDYLDQRWSQVLHDLGAQTVLVPNHSTAAADLYSRVAPRLLILSGGNNLSPGSFRSDTFDAPSVDDDLAKERDLTECRLLDLAERDGTAVLGVCRGAQLLAARHGALLSRDPAHAGTEHSVRRVAERHVPDHAAAWSDWPSQFTVASHHRWVLPSVSEFPTDLHPLAVAHDTTVEAFTDDSTRILGIMWHPEREPSKSQPGRTALRRMLERSHDSIRHGN